MIRLIQIFLSISLVSVKLPALGQTADSVGSGRAIAFDGLDDYIDFGDVYSDLDLPFTISGWVYLEPGFNQPAPIFTNRNCDPIYTGFRLIVNSNVISLEYGDGLGGNNPAFRRGKQASVKTLNGAWNHITAVVRNIHDMDLYLNGVNAGGTLNGGSSLTMDSSKPGFASSAYFISNGVTYRLKGMVDEIRLWNRALTETEIRNTMCLKLTGSEEGLIGYWDFNETSGNEVYDKSHNKIHGTFVGNPTRTFSGAPIGNKSIFRYGSVLTNEHVSLSHAGQTIEVSNISTNAAGVQLYYVNNSPSQKEGLGTNIIDGYFGVFLASQETLNVFDVEYKITNLSACQFFTREDNSEAVWNAFEGNRLTAPQRAEIIAFNGGLAQSFELGENLILCNETSYEISPDIPGSGLSFAWNSGQNTSSIVISESGTYSLTVFGGCNSTKDSISIIFQTIPPSFSLGEDVLLCEVSPVKFTGPTDSTSYRYLWQDGSTHASFTAKDIGKYWLTLFNECGETSDTINVLSNPSMTYIMPNVITPNADDKNDYFVVGSEFTEQVSLKIFNRWGTEVYSSSSYDNRWNGSDLSSGMYFILFKDPFGGMKKSVLHIVR